MAEKINEQVVGLFLTAFPSFNTVYEKDVLRYMGQETREPWYNYKEQQPTNTKGKVDEKG